MLFVTDRNSLGGTDPLYVIVTRQGFTVATKGITLGHAGFGLSI